MIEDKRKVTIKDIGFKAEISLRSHPAAGVGGADISVSDARKSVNIKVVSEYGDGATKTHFASES
jgi:hypothetical protein